MTTNFADLNLSQPLLKALVSMKFEEPSPIQAQTIPVLMQGRDVIGQAQTGTGKTAAFALPILNQLEVQSKATQALIIAPTRELAIQIAKQLELLAKELPGTIITVLCGGQDYSRQLSQLRQGSQIVVGTPGRILDHIERGTLKLDRLKTFVLDEADEMLRMGFIEDVEMILSKLPKEKQMALFSATMPTRIRHIANNYLSDPVSVEIRSETATVKTIEQKFLFATPPQKPDALVRILAVEEYQGVIIFTRTKSSTEDLVEYLKANGHSNASAIHGDISQALREKIVAQFRSGRIDILVATDVAARGLDVERVTHVINYDVPHDCETYVHRIGRTGRAGRSGVTILFITPRESRILNTIERHTRQKIEKILVPNDYMIQQARLQLFINSILERVNHQHLPSYRKIIEDMLALHPELSALDVAAILSLKINNDKRWQREAEPMVSSQATKPAREKNFRTPKQNDRFSRNPTKNRDNQDLGEQVLFRLEVGRMHGVRPGNIIGAIANEAGISSSNITNLKIHEDYSTVKLPKGMSKEMFQDLNSAWVCGRQLKLTLI